MLSQELRELLKISGGKVILDDGKIIVMKLNDYIKELKQSQSDLKSPNGKRDDSFCVGRPERKQQNGSQLRGAASADLTEAEILIRMENDLDELRQRYSEEVAENLEFEAKNIRYEHL